MINISLIIVCVTGIVCVISLLLIAFTFSDFRAFWLKHISAPFPYPDECFDCEREDCVGCSIRESRQEALMCEDAEMRYEANNSNWLYRQGKIR